MPLPPRAYPIPTVEQAEALLAKVEDPATPRSVSTYLLKLGIQAYIARKRYQASQRFKETNAKAARAYRKKHGKTLSEMRGHLKKLEWRLSQMQLGGGDQTHQDRYDRLLAKVLAARRAYAVRLGYDADALNEAGTLATISGDEEALATAELIEGQA